MTTKTAQKYTPEQIDTAKSADLRGMARRYVELRPCAGQRELQGPCPKCGGEDRFHVTADWFFCRSGTCHPKRGDAIEFVQWMEPGVSFTEAVERLLGGAVATAQPARTATRHHEVKKQPDDWKERAERHVAAAQRRLWEPEGKPGREYLESRGLDEHIWQTFGLGFDPAHQYGEDGPKLPAIVMPWRSHRAGLFAIRYRFLPNEYGARVASRTGSDFSGKLYGGHALPVESFESIPDGRTPVERLYTLLIIEGELNAMSCYQVGHETRMDVLSMGHESTRITDSVVEFAKRYGTVLVWLDRQEMVDRVMERLPDAKGIKSLTRKDSDGNAIIGADGKPKKIDANDMLQAGTLGGFLATVRADAATSTRQLEGLLWNLHDLAALPAGEDSGTASVFNTLSAKLGRRARLVEIEPGRWVAA
jgi:hypothetical protein